VAPAETTEAPDFEELVDARVGHLDNLNILACLAVKDLLMRRIDGPNEAALAACPRAGHEAAARKTAQALEHAAKRAARAWRNGGALFLGLVHAVHRQPQRVQRHVPGNALVARLAALERAVLLEVVVRRDARIGVHEWRLAQRAVDDVADLVPVLDLDELHIQVEVFGFVHNDAQLREGAQTVEAAAHRKHVDEPTDAQVAAGDAVQPDPYARANTEDFPMAGKASPGGEKPNPVVPVRPARRLRQFDPFEIFEENFAPDVERARDGPTSRIGPKIYTCIEGEE
jgi:hypothetical protein